MAGTGFVGRRDELERLGRVLRGDEGAARVALVMGDAGIGKTRLLAEALGAGPDVLVLAGACLPLSESLPYGGVADALSDLVSPSGRPTLDRALARCAPYVRWQMAALIPALSAEPRGSSASSADRSRLFAAVRDLLAALSAERRIALALEDLHWADPGTLDLLTFLVRGLPVGTAMVVTSRRDELPVDHRARGWLMTTSRFPQVEAVSLAPLSNVDVEALVASLCDGEPATSFVADVLRRSEGNPFFTEQLVAAARDVAPELEVPTGVPAGVADMLLGRISAASATANDVAAVLAIAARPLTESELAACVGTDVSVAAGLRELVGSHLVESAEQDRYRLRHALLEDAVRSTLLASDRTRLHAGAAGVLAARPDPAPAEVAMHWALASRPAEEARWSVAAARHAEAVVAWSEASDFWRRVWELWDEIPAADRPSIRLPEVVVGCVTSAAKVTDPERFGQLVLAALADERVTADIHATAQLVALHGHHVGRGADVHLSMSDAVAGLSILERSLILFERSGPSPEYAVTLRQFVRVKTVLDLTAGAEEAELARAASIAEQVGADEVLLELQASRGQREICAGHVAEGLRVLCGAIERVGKDPVGEELLWAYVALSDAYMWLLQLTDAVGVGRSGIDRGLAGGHRESNPFALLIGNTVGSLLLSGDVAAAKSVLSPDVTPATGRSRWAMDLIRADLLVVLGDLTGAAERLSDMGEVRNPGVRLWLAETGAAIDLWAGRPAAAVATLDHAFDEVVSDLDRASRTLALAARAAADLMDIRTTATRDQLSQTLRRKAEVTQCFAPHLALGACYGTTFAGELARLEQTGGESAWRASRDCWAAHGVPHEAAYAGWRLAEQLLDGGRRKDAEAELQTAYTASETHVPLRREIEHLARRARVSLPALRPVPDGPSGTAEMAEAGHGLTPRELAVLERLTAGRTNREIGHELFMSPKTASVHVTRLMRKLGVTNRVQAAAMSHRLGIDSHPDSADGPGA